MSSTSPSLDDISPSLHRNSLLPYPDTTSSSNHFEKKKNFDREHIMSLYSTIPPHMLGRPDPMGDWALDAGMPPNMAPSSMPRVMNSAPLPEPAFIPTTAHFAADIDATEHAHQQPLQNYDVMPSDGRAGDANLDGPIRCWTDRCNGREFSSIGNYRRHFREQHRVSKKFFCQRCGRPFSRSTARNLHYEKKKCRSIQLDENGVPVSLPLKDGSEPEAFSPTASLETLSSDEGRHGSVDSSFSPYTTAGTMHSMTYAEQATQPPYVPRTTREQQELGLDWDPLTSWDDGLQTWDDTTSLNYLDQPMDVTGMVRGYDMGSQQIPTSGSIPGWNGRPGVMGY